MCFYCICVISVFLGLYLKLRSRDFAASRLFGVFVTVFNFYPWFPISSLSAPEKSQQRKIPGSCSCAHFFLFLSCIFSIELVVELIHSQLDHCLVIPKSPLSEQQHLYGCWIAPSIHWLTHFCLVPNCRIFLKHCAGRILGVSHYHFSTLLSWVPLRNAVGSQETHALPNDDCIFCLHILTQTDFLFA